MGRSASLYCAVVLVALCSAPDVARAAERFPPPEFDQEYSMPQMTEPPAKPPWRSIVDVAALTVALSLAAWLALKKRNRRGLLVLSVCSLVYFGFYRKGCVCPIGAIQNVTLALTDSSYLVPIEVILFFSLPLVFALFFGRVFCGGVCPLGALQDLVIVKPVRLPLWLQHGLGLLPYVYLGLAAVLAGTGSLFLICRYDPFVPFFRLAGPVYMLITGGVFLLLGIFVGRPYCRFLCPYGALLAMLSRMTRRGASVTPDKCVVCGLCRDACPFGSIRIPSAEKGLEEQ